ncbi:MAG: hypothetical protein CM1200mP11_2310 [Nitrosopumilaceae archaeon]|nr:MAG: hypothetical protein CM1200mP11_2310 [Nitrosopumilaceae archaeon]
MKPILPTSVSLDNRWYNEHLVYTHFPRRIFDLEATDGQIVEVVTFSNREKFTMVKVVYLNKHGLVIQLEEVNKCELGGVSYSGNWRFGCSTTIKLDF